MFGNAEYLDSPVYEGAQNSTRYALRGYVDLFVSKAASKAALNEMLQHTSTILPQPNNVPKTFHQLVTLISKELVTIHKLHVCMNDCMFFRDATEHCAKCGQQRYKQHTDVLGRKTAKKVFSHTSIGEMLDLLFRCRNIAKIIQSAGGCRAQNVITDITESPFWHDEMTKDPELKIVL